MTTPTGTTFTLRGTAAARTDVAFPGMAPTKIKVDKDAFSTATFPAAKG